MSHTLPQIPAALRPADGRFGCGPSRIRTPQLQALAAPLVMGTSHRQEPVRSRVRAIREGLSDLFCLPEGWEVVLGNGGSTAFWAVAITSLVRRRAAHATFGEFGNKFATETSRAPHLDPSVIVEAAPGSVALLSGDEGGADEFARPDVFAFPHHETSTGAVSPVRRVGGTDALILVDATSIAGGVRVDIEQTDAYYFAPQKCFGSDGGLWVALLSPAAQARAEELAQDGDRWMPEFLDLSVALANSRQDQTLNTPAIATLMMMERQISWMLEGGGLAGMEARSRAASNLIYEWAEACEVATPFVERSEWRSPVVVTVDFDRDAVDAAWLARVLRASGIVDVEPYRKLGRNQLRIATFPATEVDDVHALLASIEWVLGQSEPPRLAESAT